jgi:hypothetical protein
MVGLLTGVALILVGLVFGVDRIAVEIPTRRARRQPDANEPIEATIDVNGLAWKRAGAAFAFEWSRIKLFETENGLFFSLDPDGLAYMAIPRKVMSLDQLEACRRLAGTRSGSLRPSQDQELRSETTEAP